MDKEVVIHIHNEILLSHKNNEILPFATSWMNLEYIILNEICKTEQDKYCVISYMWNLKNKTRDKHNKTETDSEIQRTNIREWGWGRR